MDEDILITLVSKYEELYNLKHPLYSNPQRRENIWVEIGKILKENGSECRDRWAKIRENYRRALILRKAKSGQGATKLKPPKHSKQLSFLAPYLHDEEIRSSNIPSIGSTNTSSVDPATDSEEFSYPFASAVSPTNSQDRSTSTSRKRWRSRNSDENSTASVLLKYYLDQRERDRERSTSSSNCYSNYDQDPLTGFFINMATTVRGFPIEEQIRIKNELFQNVNNTELRLALSQSSTSSTATGLWTSSLSTNGIELREETPLVSQPQVAVSTATSSIIPSSYQIEDNIIVKIEK